MRLVVLLIWANNISASYLVMPFSRSSFTVSPSGGSLPRPVTLPITSPTAAALAIPPYTEPPRPIPLLFMRFNRLSVSRNR
uniref:Putative secreted protein n=1 Tax=Anopheles marajoara TaxID=58244 RepID=A0A2M4CBN3_9DIPT